MPLGEGMRYARLTMLWGQPGFCWTRSRLTAHHLLMPRRVVLWELLTWELPWGATNPWQVHGCRARGWLVRASTAG